jgi:DNA-binding CsgD family transcriptional regulator
MDANPQTSEYEVAESERQRILKKLVRAADLAEAKLAYSNLLHATRRRDECRGAKGLEKSGTFDRRIKRENFAGFIGRELQVIALMAKGLKAREIAFQLGLSQSVAYNYLSSVRRKTGLKHEEELTEWAFQFGLDGSVSKDSEVR